MIEFLRNYIGGRLIMFGLYIVTDEAYVHILENIYRVVKQARLKSELEGGRQ